MPAFPKDERFGLTSQIRRSVVSIPSNIAEGYGRKTTVDYARMLYIAYGSTCELETQVLLAGDLGFIDKEDLSAAIENIKQVVRELNKQNIEASAARTLKQIASDNNTSPTDLYGRIRNIIQTDLK